MKKLITYTLATLLSLQPLFWLAFASVSVSAQQTVQEKLTNKDIVAMTKSQLPEAVILAKIKSSQTNFDTSPTALQELKQVGISDAVILAMVQPTKSSTSLTMGDTGEEVEVVVPDGTEIEVELKNTLSGQVAKIGDKVDFTVVRDVQVNGITVIEKGASATARITTAKEAGYWGKSGKLEWAMNDVQTASGVRIPARFVKTVSGGSKGGTVAVGAVATTVLLGPVGLLWGLKKGKKAEIPAGNKYSVFVDGNSTVKVKSVANASLK